MPRLRASGTKRGGTKSGGFAIDTAGAAAKIDLVVGAEDAAAPRGAALEGGPRLPPRVVDGDEGEPARPRAAFIRGCWPFTVRSSAVEKWLNATAW